MQTSQTKFGWQKIAIIVLTLITALVHLSLLFPDPLFILNGLGYLALLAIYFLPVSLLQNNHKLVRWVYMGFAAVTILAWLAIGDKSWPGGALGYFTKLVEVFLIFSLYSDR
jgi:hypothetical protein